VGSERETVAVLVRLPPDVKLWLEREAARNAGSRNSEIVRSIRKRMDSEKQPERAAG
jgi:hypothetical protein